jgi:hypothetical protein
MYISVKDSPGSKPVLRKTGKRINKNKCMLIHTYIYTNHATTILLTYKKIYIYLTYNEI